jgi:hypothetical protein
MRSIEIGSIWHVWLQYPAVRYCRRSRDARALISSRSRLRATKAIRTPKAYILLWLLYRAWKTGSNVVVLYNGHLNGISCWTKQRALLELETAGLIEIQRGRGRAPIAQLVQSRTVIAPDLRGMGRGSLKD